MSTPPKTKETANVITIAGNGFYVREVPSRLVHQYSQDVDDEALDYAVHLFKHYTDGPVKLIYRYQYERLQRRSGERIEPAKAGPVRSKQGKKTYACAFDR